jgi:hypothetical protein
MAAFVLTGAPSGATAGESQVVRHGWNAAAVADSRRSSSVGPAEKGGLTLIDRDLLRDEVGATVHAADRAAASETVTERTWIRKDFVLDPATARGAVLCVCHSGDAKGLIVRFNGTELPFEVIHTRARPYSGVYPKDKFPKDHSMHDLNGKPFKSHWEGGWQRVAVDPKLLRKGLNRVVIAAKPGTSCRFYIEQSLYPDRSAVSRDAGKTWDSDRLSSNRNLNGEYVVRLMLRRHPASGWIESEPVDLWPGESKTPVKWPSVIDSIRLTGSIATPDGTALRLLGRVGPTPAYDPETWTAWAPAGQLEKGTVNGTKLSELTRARYVQWRAELTPAADRLSAPVLNGVTVAATVKRLSFHPLLPVKAAKVTQPRIVRPSHVFVHARSTKRLRLLRKQAKLDETLGKHPRGVEQLRHIARWIRSLKAGNNGGGELEYMPTWDALLFWNFARTGEIGRMCTTRGAFFVQCATAMGYPARPMIWSHAIAEAWVDDLGTWVAFDPSGGYYHEVNGKPASMLEVAKAWKNDKLTVRRVWNSKAKSDVQPDRNVAWHTRFFIPMRSNFLESDEPREPAHGKYAFKYDGHLRWLHPKRKPLPWFSFTTSRDGDVAFTCNTVNLHLARSPETNALSVQIESDMPNVERFESRHDDGDWAPVDRTFTWSLKPGKNRLDVRGVNTFGVAGRTATAEVEAGR